MNWFFVSKGGIILGMNKYENLSKEEFLRLVEKQEAELVSKKYELVWDGASGRRSRWFKICG